MNAPPTFRILHLASSERWTGIAEPVVSVAREQQAMGHEIWLACVPGQSFERRARQNGLRFVSEFHLDRRLHPLRFFSDLARIRRFVLQNRIDVIHCHLLHDNWMASMAIGPRLRPPLLIRTFHRFERPRSGYFHRLLFCFRNDFSIATSRALLNLIQASLPLRPDLTAVVYGGVDSNRFHPAISGEPIRREFHISPDTPVAGIVARMQPGRGHRWLLNAAAEVIRRLPDARILLVGRGPLKHILRDEVNAGPLRNHVLFTGYRSRDLEATYAALDAALFLGMTSEGTCRAALEAMATGRPVIALRDGALPEIIEDGKNGLLVEPDNTAALAEALVRLLSNREECQRMGRAARQIVLERFTERQRAQATLEAYRKSWALRVGKAPGREPT